eukprot:CAMPEP_0175749886 /NCGR_PEP_ID=MMETSP0097-20121207/60389_1 /TAXON_ID=311494 /ORGANISM="Alexandrium monilatum, Strain CCMP3105" /LENGTH=68 /DNA_ID=CAMNT_0017058471 /DNA_START=1 /DNA_END=204 /DNA_ORIENTATION=-
MTPHAGQGKAMTNMPRGAAAFFSSGEWGAAGKSSAAGPLCTTAEAGLRGRSPGAAAWVQSLLCACALA